MSGAGLMSEGKAKVMSIRKLALIAVAASGFVGLSAEMAQAKPFFLFRPFLPGYNDGYPSPDDVYYMDEEEYYQYLKRQRRKQRLIQDYYSQQDDGGYEDEYVPPRKAKKKVVAKPAPKKPVARAKIKKKSVEPNTVAANKSAPKAVTTASISRPAAQSATAGAMSCSRASDIVAGYGFDSVKTSTCSGSIYSFNAVRGGKNYLVKVNSANGELTEVRKL